MNRIVWRKIVSLSAVAVLGVGCHAARTQSFPVVDAPRELEKRSHPEYLIEPPDELNIDALRIVPLPPYRVNPLDQLYVQSSKSLPNEPITGAYPVEPEGVINLGPTYGSVNIVDMTLDEAKDAIQQQLKHFLRGDFAVTVSLAQSRGLQQIRGLHLVRQDGTVGLGLYGSVYVVGMTLREAKVAIEEHLSQYLLRPEISVDVAGYNSKVVYVVTDGGGNGESVVRLPVTGNETVLDAVGQVGGLSSVSSKKRIWVARPSPLGNCEEQILPVDWCGVTQGGKAATNYQLLPGDRVYVMAQPLIAADTALGRIIAPIERVFGFILLGSGTIQTLGNNNNAFNNGGINSGAFGT